MKIKAISLGLILLVVGCNSEQQDVTETDDAIENNESDSVSSVIYDPSEAIWSYEQNQQTRELEVKQIRPVDRDTLTGETLEKIINRTWPRVQIKFIGTSNDTVFISIPDSEVMTQQMGSAGAESFMVTTTYSFTELRGIDYVSFGFEEGDHGVPGVYHRHSWDKNNDQ
ncbi:MAG: hypothetical protein JJU13_20280 [Balneolaceae bacterium]|nr:hypothetical protein [Balneolaceae bacterium]